MNEKNTKQLKNSLRTLVGLCGRVLIIAPILAILWYDGVHLNTIDNIANFAIFIVGGHAIMLLICTTLIPAEYAIKTELTVLEFNMWRPQVVALYGFSLLCFAGTFLLAGQEMYWFAGVIFTYGIAHLTWPRYVEKIDNASKLDMIEKLKTTQT